MEKKETKEEPAAAPAEQENGPLIEDEIERSKVGIMRALCDRQDPETKVGIDFLKVPSKKKSTQKVLI